MDLETRTPQQLEEAVTASSEAVVVIQEPGGPAKKISLYRLLGQLYRTDVVYETKAEFDADLDHADNSIALVYADPTPGNTGYYQKAGASGAGTWELIGVDGLALRDELATDGAPLIKGKVGGFPYLSNLHEMFAAQEISVKNAFGVLGDGSDETSFFQDAFSAPEMLGKTLLIPKPEANWIEIYDEIALTQAINIRGEPGHLLLGVFDDPLKYLLNVRPEEGVDGGAGTDVRDMTWQNFRAEVAFGTDCAGGVNWESRDGVELPFLKARWLGGRCAVPNAAAGRALRIAGVTSQLHIVDGLDIVNGVHLDGCADACRFVFNTMYGHKTAFLVDLAGGAFRTLIADNALVARDGAIDVINGSHISFLRNQVEQTLAYGANANDKSASAIVRATDYGSRGIEFAGNNWGGGSLVDYSLWIGSDGGTTEETYVGPGNSWNETVEADIHIDDAGVKYTVVHPHQVLRGERGSAVFTGYPDGYGANTDHVPSLLDIEDAGTGTSFVQKTAVALGGASSSLLINSWTCAATMCFWRDADGRIQWSGYFISPASGAAQADVVIGTLPEGHRSLQQEGGLTRAVDLTAGAENIGRWVANPNGTVTLTTPAGAGAAGHVVYACSMGLQAKRTPYNPSY